MLLLPHHPGFYEILHSSVPPGYTEGKRFSRNTALVVDHQTGVMREANKAELFDYVYGGEYQLMLDHFGASDEQCF